MKKLTWILFLQLLAATALAQNLDPLKDGVVKVQAGGKTGSGFIIEIRGNLVFILTAYHVVAGEDATASFYREPYQSLPATVAHNQHERDDRGVSILQVEVTDTRGLRPLRFSQKAQIDKTKTAYALGFYKMGLVPWSITPATLIDEVDEELLFAGTIEEGNSGGPLIQDGDVVGVVTMKGVEHNYAAPAWLAQKFIEGTVGILPVRCDAPLIPTVERCNEYIPVDRMVCDYIERANRFYVDGDYRAALAEYDQAIAYKPEYAVLFNNRGVVKLTANDLGNPLPDFEKALELDPDYLPAQANKGVVRGHDFFMQVPENYAAGKDLPNPLLERLREMNEENQDAPANPEASPLENAVGGLMKLAAAAVPMYVESENIDATSRRFRKGDLTCYGGDILALNYEFTEKKLGEMLEHLKIFENGLPNVRPEP